MKSGIAMLTLATMLMGQSLLLMGQTLSSQQQAIPDAPEAPPQTTQPSLSTLSKGVVPGSGTVPVPATPSAGATNAPQLGNAAADSDTPEPVGPHIARPDDQKVAPAFHVNLPTVPVNFVQVPVTVEDKHKNLIPGLDWRDFRIYENGQRENIAYWSVSPVPLSVALVIDQSVGYKTMEKVNTALSALPGGFAPYDEVAVIKYNSTLSQQTTFTGAQSARLTAVLEQSKADGRDIMIGPGSSSPMGQSGVYLNDTLWQTAPLITNGPSASGTGNSQHKQVHPLTDAIFMAAQALAKTESGRRRIIYVISDGEDNGSEAKYKQVVKYLQAHQIAVYGTLVGDSAEWGLGFLDRVHLPYMMADNILPKYAADTGGQFDSEYSTNGIERSFAAIAEEARNQYTIGYYSHESIYDDKYRAIQVDVVGHGSNLTVIAKPGYYPSAPDPNYRPLAVPVTNTPATK